MKHKYSQRLCGDSTENGVRSSCTLHLCGLQRQGTLGTNPAQHHEPPPHSNPSRTMHGNKTYSEKRRFPTQIDFKLGITVPVGSIKMKLSRKQFISLVNSRMCNKFCTLVNFSGRLWEREDSWVPSWSGLHNLKTIRVLPIPTSHRPSDK